MGNVMRVKKAANTRFGRDSRARRGRLAEAVNEAAVILVSHSEDRFQDTMERGVRIICEEAGLHRFSLLRCINSGEEWTAKQVYRWDLEAGNTPTLAALEAFPLSKAVPRWVPLIAKGELINSPVDELPENERLALQPFGCVSVLAVPVFVSNRPWGFALMEDRKTRRAFDAASAALLRSAGHICAGAFIGEELNNTIRESSARLSRRGQLMSTLNKAAEVFMAQDERDFGVAIGNGIGVLADAVGVDRVTMWKHYINAEGEHCSGEFYRWDKRQGGATPLREELLELNVSRDAPQLGEAMMQGKSLNGPAETIPFGDFPWAAFGVKTALFVPIFVGGEYWGYMLWEDRERARVFDDETADTLRSAAYICVNSKLRYDLTARTIRSEERLRDRSRLLSALNSASEILVSQSDEALETILSKGVERIATAVELTRCTLWRAFYVNGTQHMEEVFKWDYFDGGVTSLTHWLTDFEIERVLPRLAAELPKGTVVHGNASNLPERELPFWTMMGCKTLIFVPVFVNGVYWGSVMWEDRVTERMFDDDTLELLRSAAYICANTRIRFEMLANITRSSDELAAQSRLLARRGDLMNALNMAAVEFLSQAKQDFGGVMSAGISELAKVLRVDHVTVCKTVNVTLFSQLYLWSKADGGTAPVQAEMQNLPLADHVPVWYEKLLKGETVNESAATATGKEAAFIAKLGLKAVLIVPIFMQNAYWGCVTFDDTENNRRYGEHSVSVLTSAAHMCANAIVRHELTLHDAEQRDMLSFRLKQQVITAEIAQGLVGLGGVDDLLAGAMAKTGEYLGVSRVLIMNLSEDGGKVEIWREWDADGVAPSARRLFDRAETPLDAFPDKFRPEANVPVEIACVGEDPQSLALAGNGVRSCVCVPLYVGERLWGMLSLSQCGEDERLSERMTAFLPVAAGSVAGAIMRGIYDRERNDAMEAAIEASKAKGSFLSNMSHEMRTPLNAIIGMTTIGRQAETAERKDFSLKKIEEASKHLLGVINDVLDMSKIEADKMELSFVNFDFEKMLRKIVDVVNYRAGEKGQKIDVSLDPRLPRALYGDEQRLSQVVANLMSNAVKFTRENGEVKLSARLLEEAGDECFLSVSVQDNGIGISQEQRAHLFQSFRQADNDTSRKYGGTGLGLAISKRIIEMMGGEVTLESEPGEGSTFTFTARLLRGDAKLVDNPSPEVDFSEHGINVALVAGTHDAREHLVALFARLNIAHKTAVSIAETVRLSDTQGAFDMYFVDWETAGDNCSALAGYTRAFDGKKSEIVAVMSVLEWAEESREATTAGVDKFLIKPLFASSVAECINESIAGMGKDASVVLGGEFAGKRILLVEDVEINREILISLLEDTGVEIICATDGCEALAAFKEREAEYDVILMDLQMPNMDGLEASRRIRALSDASAQSVPIVAMTANAFKDDVERCLAAGMNDHIAKPIDIEIVMAKLRRYMARKR